MKKLQLKKPDIKGKIRKIKVDTESLACLNLKENVITYDALVCGDRHGRISGKSNLCCCRFLHGTGKIYFSCNVIAIKITVCDGDSCFRDGNRFTAAVIIKGKS